MMHKRLIALFIVVGLVAACGGKVFVDPGSVGGGGGSGGNGGAGQSSTSSSSSGNGQCANVPPVLGFLEVCGGSAAASSGEPAQCGIIFCEKPSGNNWESLCSGPSCTCSLNGQTLCTCTGQADFCSGVPSCCPFAKFAQ